jgi:hypothetical protein
MLIKDIHSSYLLNYTYLICPHEYPRTTGFLSVMHHRQTLQNLLHEYLSHKSAFYCVSYTQNKSVAVVLDGRNFHIFFNPILFASCTRAFSKWCKKKKKKKDVKRSGQQHTSKPTGSRPSMSAGNKAYKLYLKN